jgi:hypothetical protein
MSDRRRGLVDLAFSKLDKDGNGVLEPKDIVDLYDASRHPDVLNGKRSPSEILREFLDTFDVGGEIDGKVTRQEFENYYHNISASIDNDDYFELMIRNAWHISGGEGWAANSANRRVLVTAADGSQSVQEIRDDLGLKADDKAGMIARLRAQGTNVSSISLTDGVQNLSGAKKSMSNAEIVSRFSSASAKSTPSQGLSLSSAVSGISVEQSVIASRGPHASNPVPAVSQVCCLFFKKKSFPKF